MTTHISRRSLLRAGAAMALAGAWPCAAIAGEPLRYHIVAAPGRWSLVGPRYPETDVWAFAGTIPGPLIRAKQGGRLSVLVENRLQEATTVHWHGLRVPNGMDGVPDLTQKPIAPGASFLYEFDVPDAGT